MRTKLYILTGFLGGGKTTVLQHMIENLPDKKIGIIQNEFGKISIDGEILKSGDVTIMELNRGTIFCTCLRLSFVKALAEMAAYHFDYLFVESSGWGDPSNFQEILDAAGLLCGESYDFSGVICLVDALHFLEDLTEQETVYRQLKHCHLAILSKLDLAEAGTGQQLETKLRELNPHCKIITGDGGKPDLSFLQEDLLSFGWAENEDTTNGEKDKPKTLFMDINGIPAVADLKAFLLTLSSHLFRAKGFCPLEGMGWCQIDLVGRQVDIKPCENREQAQLVFISKIGPAIIKEIVPNWEQLVKIPMKLRN